MLLFFIGSFFFVSAHVTFFESKSGFNSEPSSLEFEYDNMFFLIQIHPVIPETTLPTPSETPTAADLIDLHIQFSKQDFLDLQS